MKNNKKGLNMEELKPCPFCGSELTQMTSYLGEWWVVCCECFCSTAMETTEKEAIKAWNKRKKSV